MAIDGRGHGGSIRCRAPAKVNLYLHVLNRQPGRISRHRQPDRVCRRLRRDRGVAGKPPGVEAGRALRPAAGGRRPGREHRHPGGPRPGRGRRARTRACRSHCTRICPSPRVSAVVLRTGPATLRALCKLWDLDVSESELQTIARRLGADVPACLGRSPVYVGGVGEIVNPAPALPDAWLLLVNPGVPPGDGGGIPAPRSRVVRRSAVSGVTCRRRCHDRSSFAAIK